jgi:hypothetical protein
MAIYEPHRRPFNTPLEIGLRALFVLDAIAPIGSDLQRLVFYDYLLVHSGDPDGGPPSLHAAVPHRSGEWMVRRELLAAGLNLMFSKELVEKSFQPEGMFFTSTELTKPFLTYLTSPYAEKVRVSAAWLSGRFGSYSDRDLLDYMIQHLGRWGAEFYREAKLLRSEV